MPKAQALAVNSIVANVDRREALRAYSSIPDALIKKGTRNHHQ